MANIDATLKGIKLNIPLQDLLTSYDSDLIACGFTPREHTFLNSGEEYIKLTLGFRTIDLHRRFSLPLVEELDLDEVERTVI